MFKKTVSALGIAALTGVGAMSVLPTAQAASRVTNAVAIELAAACNPCNPCAAKKNACNPCNPCAAKKNACNPCNPCAAKKKKNPCNPCNPCAAKKSTN